MYDFFNRSPSLGPPVLSELDDYIHPEDHVLWRATLDHALKNGNSYKIRFRSLFPDGEFLWLEGVGKSRRDVNGKLIGLSGTCQDVTEMVVAEEEVKFERAKSMQNAKLASLGEMSAGIAHEINNPLAIITGAVWKLDKFAGEPEKLRARIETIEKAAERIEKIVGGLRKFSRSSSVKTELKHVPLASIIKEALILTEAKASRYSIMINTDLNTEGFIWCDEIEIEQVLINLINNAIDAVRDKADKWVRVELLDRDQSVVLKVSDSGRGIPPEVRKKLFQPFFTTKPVGEGTGLGLSIVKGILDEHNATIEAISDAKNTTFEIIFPKQKKSHAA